MLHRCYWYNRGFSKWSWLTDCQGFFVCFILFYLFIYLFLYPVYCFFGVSNWSMYHENGLKFRLDPINASLNINSQQPIVNVIVITSPKLKKIIAWGSMGNRGASQHWLHIVPTTIEPLLSREFPTKSPSAWISKKKNCWMCRCGNPCLIHMTRGIPEIIHLSDTICQYRVDQLEMWFTCKYCSFLCSLYFVSLLLAY